MKAWGGSLDSNIFRMRRTNVDEVLSSLTKKEAHGIHNWVEYDYVSASLDTTNEMIEWCKETFGYYVYGGSSFGFKDPEEAIMFKLTWC